VAIIAPAPDPEIERMRDYLCEMGLGSRVFVQGIIPADVLLTFKAVIWNDLGAHEVTDDTVSTLRTAFSAGIPIYLIGGRLGSSANHLTDANRSTWFDLLQWARPQLLAPQRVEFSKEEADREPGTILNGAFGSVEDFDLADTVELGRAYPTATPLGTAAALDAFVVFPPPHDPDTGQVRSATQAFRVWAGTDGFPVQERKELFQNTVCWLTRCRVCTAIGLTVEAEPLRVETRVGELFTYSWTIRNNGECLAFATILTNQLPPEVQFRSASFREGLGFEFNPNSNRVIWNAGRVRSGPEGVTVSITGEALRRADVSSVACVRANRTYFDPTANCGEVHFRIEGPLGDDGAIFLEITAIDSTTLIVKPVFPASGVFDLESSKNLKDWRTESPSDWPRQALIPLDETPYRFYRLRRR